MIEFPHNNWYLALKDVVDHEKNQEFFKWLDYEYSKKHIVPKKENIFKAFENTDFLDVKVVIIGQDPYPNPKNPMGLSFSVNKNVAIPGSLQNIFKDQEEDLGISYSEKTKW